MSDRGTLYWLRRNAIDELESAYEDKDWDEVADLIDELRRIHKNIEEFVMIHGCF